jgi:hypothetical protein
MNENNGYSLALFLPFYLGEWTFLHLEPQMIKTENETRLDLRKAVIGGLLAWVMQALALWVFRLP